VAQVFGHQVVAFDDGKPAEEPTAVGRTAGTRELRRAATARGRGRHDTGTGKRTGRRRAPATAAEPSGLASGRHAGDGGQDGPPAFGAPEPGPGHQRRRPRAAVHHTAPGQPAGRRAVHATGAS